MIHGDGYETNPVRRRVVLREFHDGFFDAVRNGADFTPEGASSSDDSRIGDRGDLWRSGLLYGRLAPLSDRDQSGGFISNVLRGL